MSIDRLLPYATPAAFRRAVTDRLRTIAAPHGPWPLADIQRQFAYDRLLVRLYLLDDGWVLKGAAALLARGIAVRHTVDIDVYRAAARQVAERDLRGAISLHADDWFEFEAAAGRPIADGAGGTRVPVTARIAGTAWARFHVDVVAAGVVMTGRPDRVAAITPIGIPGLSDPHHRVYPLVDHIADKTCAVLERSPAGRPSTRFKDLVDLVVVVAHARPTAVAQETALRSEAARRGLTLPSTFDVPDESIWLAGYAAEARRARRPVIGTLAGALATVRPFLDPLFQGYARGRWDPDLAIWA